MGNGIKVYYNPMISIYDSTSCPILYGCFKKFREIVIKENINLVHCHQCASVTAAECLMHARTMGLHTVYTEHSLYGFGYIHEVNINKVIRSIFCDLDECITVSNILRDNIVLRSMFNPRNVNVIPNGVDITKFYPENNNENNENHHNHNHNNIINIISISRQTYRKGTDLLIEIIPEICKLYPNVNFIIGGDGPKKYLLDNMVKSSNLENRVQFTGSLAHNKVREIMIKGNIYLNTSLTESFCIAIVEAASTGLFTISTDVGGVGEVLPDKMVKLVSAEKNAIIKGIKECIENINFKVNNKSNKDFYKELKNVYNWDKVANKTVKVYEKTMKIKDKSIITRIKKALAIGNLSGIFYVCLICVDYLFFIFFSIFQPVRKIQKEKNFKYENYKQYLKSLKQ
jgi:phosphatidylinositol glycan class A protein